MNAELEHLLRLQETDREILNLQEKVRRIPQEIQQLEQIVQQSRAALEEAEGRLEDNRDRRRQLERDVEDLRQKLSKYKTQLMEVKSNKEYQAVLHEIEGVENAISEREDEILEMMLTADEHKEELAKAHSEFQEREQEAVRQQREIEAFAEQADKQIGRLTQLREEVSSRIAPGLLTQYQRLANAHNGVALAEARDQSCQACHVRLRPQVFAEVRMNREIHRCESCSRILYYIPPPPAESQAAQ